MRKALVLLCVLAAGAVAAGLAIPSSVVQVGASTLSAAQLNDELSAIAKSPAYDCYLASLEYDQTQGQQAAPGVAGATAQTWSAGGAVLWTNIRTTQLAVDGYVATHDPAAFSPASLKVAAEQLAVAIGETIFTASQEGSSAGNAIACVSSVGQLNSNPQLAQGQELGLGDEVLATVPRWFDDVVVQREAGTLGLLTLLVPEPIPTSGPGLRAWYAAHAASFETTCLSDLVVATQGDAQSIADKIDKGLSIATAAHRYSLDPTSRSKGGVIGCFSPNDTKAWAAVVQYVGQVPTGKANVVDLPTNQGTVEWFVIGPTKRTPNSFAAVASAVASEAQQLNIQGTQQLATAIQRSADISITPQLGAWVATALGGTITPSSVPPSAAILNAAANTPVP